MRLSALVLAAAAFASSSAFAQPITTGVGLALRLGAYYNGGAPGGVSLDARFGMFGLEVTKMTAVENIREHVEGDGLFSAKRDVTADTAEIRNDTTDLTLKLHPMNGSFYFGFTIGQQTTTGTLKVSTPSETVDETVERKRTIHGISIGNLWTPGGVMIGCEWAGLFNAYDDKTEISGATDATDADLDSAKTYFERKVRESGSAGHALIMYLGYMIGS